MGLVHKKMAEYLKELQINPEMTPNKTIHALNADIMVYKRYGNEENVRTAEELRNILKYFDRRR